MEKRTVITVAGAVTLTVLASSSAMAVNFRGANDQPPGGVGTFSPSVDTAVGPPQTVRVFVDVPPDPALTTPSSSVPVAAAPQPAMTLDAGSSATQPDTTTRASAGGEGEHGGDEHHSEGDGGGHDDD